MRYTTWVEENENTLIRNIDKNLWGRYIFTIPLRYYDFFNIDVNVENFEIEILYEDNMYLGTIRRNRSYKDTRYNLSMLSINKLIDDFCKIKVDDIGNYKLKIIRYKTHYEIELLHNMQSGVTNVISNIPIE